jgi:hypothetical protein
MIRGAIPDPKETPQRRARRYLPNCPLLTRQLAAAPLDWARSPQLLCIGNASPFRAGIFLRPYPKKRPQLGEAEAVVICCARQPRGGVDANAAQYTQHTPVSDDDLY